MIRDFLAYWKPSTVDTQVEKGGGPLEHAASNQFGRVSKCDTVWLVTVRDGRLRLVTRIVVAHVTGQAGAARLLGCDAADLWEAEYHIVAAEGTEVEILDTDIQHLAPSLRFESAGGNDRLTLAANGRVNAQQLQTMRVLSAASAELLARVMS
jgi:hypothetical protein